MSSFEPARDTDWLVEIFRVYSDYIEEGCGEDMRFKRALEDDRKRF